MQLIERCFTGLSICLFFTTVAYAQVKYEKAVFAGGCFWCMTPPFEKLNGVVSVVSGYTGGKTKNPNYENYSQGGHLEAIEVTYDPAKITYTELLDVFWKQIDPIDPAGQFCDRGRQYRPVIFYHNQKQKLLAEQSKEALEKSGRFDRPLATELLEASIFYKAEDYHQDYHKKNPLEYEAYRSSCGRDQYLQKVWKQGDGKKKELKKKLTPLQCQVTQDGGTEPAFQNEYWDNHREGIYVDIISGEALFSSTDKYDSGTGWPSFSKPLEPENIVEKQDNSSSMKRTEIRSKQGDAHLGHVFDDGPSPGGLRFCMNSAALRFIPKEDLEKAGYGKHKVLFEKKN